MKHFIFIFVFLTLSQIGFSASSASADQQQQEARPSYTDNRGRVHYVGDTTCGGYFNDYVPIPKGFTWSCYGLNHNSDTYYLVYSTDEEIEARKKRQAQIDKERAQKREASRAKELKRENDLIEKYNMELHPELPKEYLNLLWFLVNWNTNQEARESFYIMRGFLKDNLKPQKSARCMRAYNNIKAKLIRLFKYDEAKATQMMENKNLAPLFQLAKSYMDSKRTDGGTVDYQAILVEEARKTGKTWEELGGQEAFFQSLGGKKGLFEIEKAKPKRTIKDSMFIESLEKYRAYKRAAEKFAQKLLEREESEAIERVADELLEELRSEEGGAWK